jgi:hypothetical protein
MVLPLASLLSIFLLVVGLVDEGAFRWRRAFLLSSLLWGVLFLLSSEGLSLFSALSKGGVAIFWGLALILALGLGSYTGAHRKGLAKIKSSQLHLRPFEWLVLGALTLILVTLAVVGWMSPPNNTDSLLYHMPRISHWIQNASLKHYPTGYMHQLWAAPFAEMMILNLKLLWGNDQVANVVQWFSLIGSLIGVSAIASLLGVSRRGQWLTAAFAVSIPMAILQSTSTQTDLVTSFWLICLSYFVVLSRTRDLRRVEWLSLGLAIGLGLLTKGTFYLFAFPLLLWLFIPRLRRFGLQRTILQGLGLLSVVVLLNLGHWTRNVISFGNPLGPSSTVSDHTEISLAPLTLLSKVVKQTSLNFATPWPGVNTKFISTLETIHNFIGLDLDDFEFTWAWNNEDLAGSPIHFSLIAFSILTLIFLSGRRKQEFPLFYAIVVLGAFFTFSAIVRFNIFIVRLQLPILLLGAPLVGQVLSDTVFKRSFRLATFGFLLASLPWVLFNSTKPILAMRPDPEPMAIPCITGCTRSSSIFQSSREERLFVNWPELRQPILSASSLIDDNACRNIGLRIDSSDKEYLFWSSLDRTARVETIYTFPELESYKDPSFKPCAILCTICGERTAIHGLDRVGEFDGLSVYLGEEFSEDVDG